MGLFRRGGRNRGAEPTRTGRQEIAQGERHLTEFAKSRRGVEAFVEPATAVTSTTVVLIAADGEWTRRRVADPRAARSLADKLRIPLYEAAVVGYPQRMREWNRRKAQEEKDALGG